MGQNSTLGSVQAGMARIADIDSTFAHEHRLNSMQASAEFEIRSVASADEMEAVYRITHDAYVRQGYCVPQPDGRLVHYPHLDGIPETTVLVAVVDGLTVGTVSITMDGPTGLHADEEFKDVCDRIRSEGRRLAACWRIATQPRCRSEAEIVLGLVREAEAVVLRKGADTCLLIVNPRHEGIYKKLLNMETVARKTETIGALRNAPPVLMRLSRENRSAMRSWSGQ